MTPAAKPEIATVAVQSDLSALDHNFASAPAFLELTQADAAAYGHDSRPPIPFDPTDSVRFNFYQEDDARDFINSIEPETETVSKNGSGGQAEQFFERLSQTAAATDAQDPEIERFDHIEQPVELTEAPVVDARDSADESEIPEELTEREVSPGGSWDYRQGEIPVFVGPAKHKTYGKLRWAVAVGFVSATVAAFYFFVYQPSTPNPQIAFSANASKVSGADSPAGSVTKAVPGPGASVQPDQPAGARSEAVAAPSREAAASDSEAPGRFSLQAAAFPTQGGADEFAGKLKQAGLPSYVVPADLARRGRWFRVRVGRFSSAEDAQKYAGEAQQRGRAAGLAMQLIVCQYDKP